MKKEFPLTEEEEQFFKRFDVQKEGNNEYSYKDCNFIKDEEGNYLFIRYESVWTHIDEDNVDQSEYDIIEHEHVFHFEELQEYLIKL